MPHGALNSNLMGCGSCSLAASTHDYIIRQKNQNDMHEPPNPCLLLMSCDNRWSSKSHHACMFGRVVTEVNAVKIRLRGKLLGRYFMPTY